MLCCRRIALEKFQRKQFFGRVAINAEVVNIDLNANIDV